MAVGLFEWKPTRVEDGTETLMRKSLLKKLGVGALLFAGVLYLIATFSGSFVQSAIETIGPKVLGVNVRVGEVYLLPFIGKASIKGLRIQNLPGYKEKYLFEVGSISASLNLKSLVKETIVIDSIEIKGPVVAWEGSASESNVTKLQKQVMNQLPAEEAAGKKLLIKHLSIYDAKANVILGKNKPMLLSLPPIVLENVHSDRKADAVNKVVGAVFAEVSRQIVSEIAQHPELLGDTVGDAIEGVVNGVKGLFGK